MGKQKRIKEQKAREAAQRRRAELLDVQRLIDNVRPSLATLRAFVDIGAARVGMSPDGEALEAEINAERAWAIDPWFWETIPVSQKEIEGHARLGTDPPRIYFVSRDYQVAVFLDQGQEGWPDMWHLSLKRRDREPIDSDRWRTFQKIKNTIVGPTHEAVELYPSEKRLVDTANQYHLWVLTDPDIVFPFGFMERLVAEDSTYGAKQRAFPDGDRPDDLQNEYVNEKMAEFKKAGV